MKAINKKMLSLATALLLFVGLMIPTTVAHAADLNFGHQFGDVSVSISNYLGERHLSADHWADLHAFLEGQGYYVGALEEIGEGEQAVFLFEKGAYISLNGAGGDEIELHNAEIYGVNITENADGSLSFEQDMASPIDLHFPMFEDAMDHHLYVLKIAHTDHADNDGSWFVIPIIFDDSETSPFEFVISGHSDDVVHEVTGASTIVAVDDETPGAAFEETSGIATTTWILIAAAVVIIGGAAIFSIKRRSNS